MFGFCTFVRISVTVYVSLRSKVRRTLYDFYCLCSSPQLMVKLTRRMSGHFVTLTYDRQLSNECNPRHISFYRRLTQMKFIFLWLLSNTKLNLSNQEGGFVLRGWLRWIHLGRTYVFLFG